MARTESDPDALLDAMDHSRRAEIDLLRRAVLAAEPSLVETVKWNAPSYRVGADDRITFRLQPKDRVELIFHRGAKRRDDQASFEFVDPTGLVHWLESDRGVIACPDAAETERCRTALADLVPAWIAATT